MPRWPPELTFPEHIAFYAACEQACPAIEHAIAEHHLWAFLTTIRPWTLGGLPLPIPYISPIAGTYFWVQQRQDQDLASAKLERSISDYCDLGMNQRSALTRARKKVPLTVFRDILRQAVDLAYKLWPHDPAYLWHVMTVIAIDGSKDDLPATEENRKEFDPNSGLDHEGRGRYPRGESTDAEHWDGPTRMSDEGR